MKLDQGGRVWSFSAVVPIPRSMRLRLLPLALGLLLAACGSEPPDAATSERQIRQTAIDFNVLTASGQGEQACALLTPEKREGWIEDFPRAWRDAMPPDVDDCVSWVGYQGRILPEAVRNEMRNAQVSVVTVDGDRGTATWATGGTMPVRWTDGRWRLD